MELLKDSKAIDSPWRVLLQFPYCLGVLGILLIPMDSSPYFPVPSDNRPFWALPFAALFMLDLVLRRRISRMVVFLGCLILFVIVQSFFQYHFFGYENYNGFYKGVFVFIILFFTVGGLDLFIKYLIDKFGRENLMPVVARLFAISSFLPIVAGVLQLLYIFGLPFLSLAESFTHLFAYRFYHGRLQLISGEPSWASVYLIFAGTMIGLFHPPGKFKTILLSAFAILFLFTGSTIGYIYVAIILTLYLLMNFNIFKLILMGVGVLFLGGIVALNVYPLLSPYTQTKIAIVFSLVDNLTFKNILQIAAQDWSFMARFLNPVIAYKLSYENYFLGGGVDSFQYIIIKELIKMDFLGTLSADDMHMIRVSGSTPKSLFAKILYENGFLVWGIVLCANLFLIRAFLRNKRLLFMLLVVYVLVLNDDSYLSYSYLLTFFLLFNISKARCTTL